MRCFVKGCTSAGYRKKKCKETVEKRHSFSPATEEILRDWQKAVPGGEKLTKQHRICEFHFEKDDIVTEFVTKMPDGSEHRLKRERALLRKGAIPKFFSDLSIRKTNEAFQKVILKERQENIVKNNEVFLLLEGEDTDFKKMVNFCDKIPLPSKNWFVNTVEQFIQWTSFCYNLDDCSKIVRVNDDKTVNVLLGVNEVKIPNFQTVNSVNDVVTLLKEVDKIIPCGESERSNKCLGFIVQKEKSRGRKFIFCTECAKLRKKLQENNKDSSASVGILRKLKMKNQKLKDKCRNSKKKEQRLVKTGKVLKKTVKEMQRKCAVTKEEVLNGAIFLLSEKEQLAVRTCFNASKLKNRRGIRYSRQWLYECILLRIKSKKAYKHLRKHKILVLPSTSTLERHMRHIKSSYGFQESVFRALKFKTEKMDPKDRHGALLIDEMKLSTSLSFNKMNLKFEGFTNLGDHTPEHQKSELGDHALIFMFQSFMTGQIQTLGCFLSKGSATSTVLHKLLIECILLAENAGLRIDVVTSDGASWNRAMWKLFGVSEDSISITHIADEKRKLWFISDFPHLVKCLRNFFIKHGINVAIWTPDGLVALIVWYAILQMEDTRSYGIKVNYKLTIDHVEPKYYQKMNVALAFQFFGIADILEIFQNEHPDLEDCEAAKMFCRQMKGVMDAMNSKHAFAGMAPGNDSYNKVKNFLEYIKKWRLGAMEHGYEFMPESTYYGLKISLQATLELCDFLTKDCGFSYLLTARVNQDALERFFGMMRESCGANDHPDSHLFIQMYRLISTYSLVQPPRGSNISNSEIFDVLLQIKDIDDAEQRKEQWHAQLDTILDRGCMDIFVEATDIEKEHDYSSSRPSQYAIAYISGYVARKAKNRFAKLVLEKKQMTCDDCVSSLELSANDVIPESHKLIEVKSKGGLKHPSKKLTLLITAVENNLLSVMKENKLNADLMFEVTKKLESSNLPTVGCSQHCLQLSHRILSFYLTTRMYFVAKQSTKNNIQRNQVKEKRKAAKLVDESILSQEPQVALKTRKRKTN